MAGRRHILTGLGSHFEVLEREREKESGYFSVPQNNQTW